MLDDSIDETTEGKTALDRDAPIPLYHQIYLQIRDEILSGQRPYGTILATEQEMTELFGVSRITARRVLNELAQNNFVERRRRLGTRVIFKSPAKPIEGDIHQALDSLMALGDGTTVNVMEIAKEAPTPGIASALKIPKGESVIRAIRVRCLDGMPLGHVVSYVPAELSEQVTSIALAKMPILRLLENSGYKAERAEQTIGATLADTRLAEALDLEPRAALLRIGRTVYDKKDRPFLVTIANYRADKFNIRIDLHGSALDV
ncbi:GntR family transcriptional regulator [Henriciella sp. AS95]|uniref:GntR family transcriptional regulator n=1 Tax=Henriciella sp. AS95 TaxID=3135782 RepID=UPI00317A3112